MARIKRFWQWAIQVETEDPLRRALNRGFAVVVIALVFLDLLFIAANVLYSDTVKAILGIVALPLHAYAFRLNRRGTTYGAWVMTLQMVFATVAGMSAYGPVVTEGVVPLALVFPVVTATLFIRPQAGFWALLIEIGALAAALSIIGVPWEQALPFLATALIALIVVAIFLAAGASIVWRALRGSIEANMLLQSENAERKRAEERLFHLAHHDVLTSLPNRALLQDHLQLAMREASRSGRTVAVLLLDIDRFKTINDSLGHMVGDKLLKAVGRRLTESVRAGDTVARLGGDEYVLILPGLQHTDDTLPLVRKILDSFIPEFKAEGHTIHVTGSVGIALYPSDGKNADELLHNADVAMYRAKEIGQNSYYFYAAEMTTRAQHRMAIEYDLRVAIEADQFVLHYQPIVELRTGLIVAAEALLRCIHPQQGLRMPSEFITIAEDSGLILPIGSWVLRTACRQCRDFGTMGVRPVRMVVNLSARQFQQKMLVNDLIALLRETSADPALITIEITESTLMRHEENTEAVLRQVCDLGMRISVDDFGTGYSSLAYLKRFPISVLKIDRSFIIGIGHDPNDEAIVTAIIAMAKSLRIQVVAEGIETERQLRFLDEHECDMGQGFVFRPALMADEFIALMKNSHWRDVGVKKSAS